MRGVMDEAYRARQNESHTREFRLRSYRWTPDLGGEKGFSQPLGLTLPGGRVVYDIPIEDGDLTLDSTDPHTRKLRVVVPGEEWIPTSASSPLAPFGQYFRLHVRLDMPSAPAWVAAVWAPFSIVRHTNNTLWRTTEEADSNDVPGVSSKWVQVTEEVGGDFWGHWVKLGEFPIISNEVDRPSGTVTVEAADWSHRVDEFGFTKIWTCAKGTSVEQDVRQIVDEALPHKVYATKVSAKARTVYHDQKRTSKFGDGRWKFIQEVCEDNGLQALFDRNGDLVIRNAVFDADGWKTGIDDYDIGSISNPVGLLNEDDGGSIISLTPKTTRENAANGVFIRIVPSQKAKTSASSSEKVNSKWIDRGDAMYGDVFGRITHCEEKNVKKVTQKVLTDLAQNAEHLLSRRGGVLRQLDIEALPQWHFDVDDRINVRWRKRMPDFTELFTTESHFIESMTLPLTPNGTMKITTRQVAQRQLEQDWVMEPEPDPDYRPPDSPADPSNPEQPGSGVVPLPPTAVPAPAYTLLERYKGEITRSPSKYPDNVRYGRVTAIADGDTLTADIYTSSSLSTRGTIPHPDGNYATMKLRFLNLQAHETSWGVTGPAAEAFLRTIVSVGSTVMIRWDSVRAADNNNERRVWAEVYVKQGTAWRNLTLHMLDGGWGLVLPHSDQNRNTANRIGHMKVAVWHGYGMYDVPGAHHGSISIEVTGNPEGADTTKNEFAILRNKTGSSISIAGWHFGDTSPRQTYTFPAGSFIPANSTVKVVVGRGTLVHGSLYYMGEGSTIWNNDGDIAVLHDTNWRVSALAHFWGDRTEQILIRPTVLLQTGEYPRILTEDLPEIEWPGVGG